MDREFKGKFDMGWEKLREQIFENQKRLGVIPANAQLTPWPDDLPKWDSLTAVQKKLYAHQAEVYAGYTAYTDYEIGRVIQEVQDMGKLDNTLIIYIDGDNGTSQKAVCLELQPDDRLQRRDGRPEPLQLLHYNDWAPTRPIRIWQWRGRGHSIRPLNGPSRWRRTSAVPARHGDFVARPHQGCRRNSHSVPPHH